MAFDTGGMMGGAMGGASIGTTLMPGVGTVLGGIAGGLLGGFGKKKGKPGQMIIFDPDKGVRENDVNPLIGQTAAYTRDNLGRLSQGLAPSWYTKSIGGLRNFQREQASRDFYGTGINRGQSVVDNIGTTASLMRMNPRAYTQQMAKATDQYQNQLRGIDDSINRYFMNIMSQQEGNLLPMAGQLRSSLMNPQATFQPGTPDSNPMASTLAGIGGMMGGMGGGSNPFAGLFAAKSAGGYANAANAAGLGGFSTSQAAGMGNFSPNQMSNSSYSPAGFVAMKGVSSDPTLSRTYFQ